MPAATVTAAGITAALALALSVGRGPQRAHAARVAADARRPPRADGACTGVEPGVARVAMRNVAFRAGSGVVLDVHRLDGGMRPRAGGIVDLDDPRSYDVDVESAEIGLTGESLSALLNAYVFGYPGAPLRRLKVTAVGTQLRQTGTIHKGVDIPFDMLADVSVMPDGRIRLHPTRMRIFNVNGNALMQALHLTLQRMVDLSKARGVTAEGNDMLIDPSAVLPPPAIRARITAVRVEGSGIVQTMTGTFPSTLVPNVLPDSAARNYMYYRCGTLRFGKLTMSDAEMLIVDTDATNPFDFDNAGYQRQLVAGRSRTLPGLGLEVFMPDASRLDDR
jgi:hypothetical protein